MTTHTPRTPFVSARIAETPLYEIRVHDMDGIPETHHVFDRYVVITLANGDELEHTHNFPGRIGRDGQDQSGADQFLARVEGRGVVCLDHWRAFQDPWAFYRGAPPNADPGY